jgi:DNA-binding MarR family transcriptional regulator
MHEGRGRTTTHDDTPDIDLTGDLQSLGITSLCQWDVMVFLHRHGDTLTGANHLARLLGYETALIVTAIEALEAAGLIMRSRVPQGARFYQFISPLDARSREVLERLLSFTSHRAGRLRLAKHLSLGDQPAGEALQARRRYLAEGRRARRLVRLRSVPPDPQCNQKKEHKWLKAV